VSSVAAVSRADPIAPTFEQIKPRIAEVLEGKIIVGHAVFNDLAVRERRQCSGRPLGRYVPG
jgi:hypothetical protein